MERGFVKLFRNILDTGLIEDAKAWQLYSYLLLNATHQPRQTVVGGLVLNLKEGDVIFGYEKYAEKLHSTMQSIRTSLNLLKKLKLVSCKITSKCQIISLQQWDILQGHNDDTNKQTNKQINNQPTNSQQAINKQLTTEQEYKNIRMKECKNQDINPLTPFSGGTDENGGETPQSAPKPKRKREPTGNSREELIAYIKAHAISDELQEALIAFEEMRRVSLKKPLTDSAVKLLFNKLRRLAPNDEPTQTLIVQQSVMNGYQGVFDLQQPKQNLQPHKQTTKEAFDIVDRTFEKLRAAGFNV